MSRVTRHVPRPTTPMTLEVLERRQYHVDDPQVAADLRQALAADDTERIDELTAFLDTDTPQTTEVIDYREVTCAPAK